MSAHKAGRKKNEVTEDMKVEADEILDLAFKDVGKVTGRLTYNKVVKFNKDIANNPDYKRKNGEFFNFLGDRFWSKTYEDGKPYYGRMLIDKLKSSDDIEVGGSAFIVNNKDIESLVNRYHTKPEELKKRLINLFSKDREQILSLKVINEQLDNRIKAKDKQIASFEKSFASMFFNSASTRNSLDDVFSLVREDDAKVKEELLNMFNNDTEKIYSLTDVDGQKNNIKSNDRTTPKDADKDEKSNNSKVVSLEEQLKLAGLASSRSRGL